MTRTGLTLILYYRIAAPKAAVGFLEIYEDIEQTVDVESIFTKDSEACFALLLPTLNPDILFTE